MVEAKILFKDGNTTTVWDNDFAALFERLKRYENIVRFNARSVTSNSLRQGRC